MPDLLPTKEHSADDNNIQKKVDPSVYHQPPAKKKSHLLWRSSVILAVVVVFIGLGFIVKVILAVNSTNAESGKKIGLFEQIKHLMVNPEKQLNGENTDRINILLAGIGGPGHDGAYLTDTIMLVSYKPSTQEAATLSIPRDLYVEIPNYGWRKINNALAFGREASYPGGGEALLANVVSQVTGLPIHYYARIDFEGFKKVIDDLNGIDVYIDNSFNDYEYPDYNYGIQHISFKQGSEHMSGERALQYVRSRHGTNGEGSDFARSKRQQKVLLAIREKMLSLHTITNPAAMVSVLDDLGSHNQTNFQIWEILKFAKFAQNIQKNQLISQVLETGPDGLLKSETTSDGAYILRPKTGDFSEIQYLAENIFNASWLAKENAQIEIQNSTSQAGLANSVAGRLRAMQYQVAKVGNTVSGADPLSKTVIFDNSAGKNPYTLISLKNMLKADISTALPAGLIKTEGGPETIDQTPSNNFNAAAVNTDILIILGTDLISSAQLSSDNAKIKKKNL